MVPAPVVEKSMAREAVMSVVRTIHEARPMEERASWDAWETAFDGDGMEDIGRIWSSAGSRDRFESDIKTIWRQRVGRDWGTSGKGEIAEVEIE